ncbi:cell wall hydrolase [Sphingomonas ginsenosidimutans]|jgi:spore germination cell wall hydrolase CwlJ-like protein|uniref:Cell wall hydrolase n=1 Tax=Sphingomonas ginsenosidimutans TaxID=862134 RepID=A0A2A4HXG3_9SPHN|nr:MULTISPECIES: cell wall hydrolase [Sphingomonas]MBY0300166.1 cell wall hydrolase [Sphingomonas ginsenosidimutans]PCG09060.1 cell wall hydrolase [Sphingomonas ginsenosidimutans]
MSFASRVATFAALSLSLVGMIAQSSAGIAAESPTLPTTASVNQLAAPAPVPAPIPAIVATTTPLSAQTAADTSATPSDDVEEEVAYPTLAAAVADQSVPSNAGEDLRCLAGAIYFESRGEPLAGQLAVAEVILNRSQSRRFGGSVCDVITQRGQFSFVRGGKIPSAPVNNDWRTAVAVAKVALKNAWESNASEAMYFNARHVGRPSRVKVAAIGNHIFYR